jgi:hypothetical protein
MSNAQPSNIYVSSADSTWLSGPGSFIANLGGGVLGLASIELTEFHSYNLFPTFPSGSVILFRMQIPGEDVVTFEIPVLDTTPFSRPQDMVNALNTAFIAFGVANEGVDPYDDLLQWIYDNTNPAELVSYWALVDGKLAYIPPQPGSPIGGVNIEFSRSGPGVTTNANKWLGVELSQDRSQDWQGDFTNLVYFPNYPQITRTTCFYVRSTMNSADSITVRYGISSAERTILAKVPNTAINAGDAIFYQPTIPDPISKNAIGSSVYEIIFNVLDDRFQPMLDLPTNCVIHMSFRCLYERSS